MYSISNFFTHKIIIATQLSYHTKTHYDVLNLPRNCTAKQIKDSFIKLSKKHHPDLNKSKDAHAKFLAINESYKILSNVQSRRNYDLGLIPQQNQVNSTYGPEVYNRASGNNYWSDPTFYHNRYKNRDNFYSDKSYYGIKGQAKVSNFTVVAVCVTLASLIVSLQALAIIKSTTFHRDELVRKSEEAENSLKELKRTVELNGNQLQMELLNSKFAAQEKLQRKKS